jgi:hypothetical protein
VFVKHIEIAQNAGTGVRRTLLPRWSVLATMGAMGCGAVSIEPSLQSDDAGASSLDAIGVEPPGQDAQFSDDATVALVVVPAEFTDVNAPMRILQAGDHVDLVRAPQGGHISMLAAQVRNMSTDAATIRVRMRRPDTGFIVAEEKRTVAMVPVPGQSGTMQPDLRSRSQVAHVPLCPDYDPVDIHRQPLDAEIEVIALYTEPPRVGTARLRLVPSCRQTISEDEALCRCECEANYTLGKCATDAGRPR